jgi:hypothetical protein
MDLAVPLRTVERKYMRHIRTRHVAKENAEGRHYTTKSPVAAMQALDPIHPAPSKNLTTRPQLLKLG